MLRGSAQAEICGGCEFRRGLWRLWYLSWITSAPVKGASIHYRAVLKPCRIPIKYRIVW